MYQKRTLIVTQTNIVSTQKNNRNLSISKLQNRHTIKDCLFRFDFLELKRALGKVALKRCSTSE